MINLNHFHFYHSSLIYSEYFFSSTTFSFPYMKSLVLHRALPDYTETRLSLVLCSVCWLSDPCGVRSKPPLTSPLGQQAPLFSAWDVVISADSSTWLRILPWTQEFPILWWMNLTSGWQVIASWAQPGNVQLWNKDLNPFLSVMASETLYADGFILLCLPMMHVLRGRDHSSYPPPRLTPRRKQTTS